jgi:hypothetical protein
MEGKDGVRRCGEVTIKHIRNGEVIAERSFSNTLTNTGFAASAARLYSDSVADEFVYIAVGTGTTAATAADTGLEAEITDSGFYDGAARYLAVGSRTMTTVTNDTTVVAKTFTATASKSVTEYALFNATTGGVMLCRTTDTAVPMESTDQLSVTWKIKNSA